MEEARRSKEMEAISKMLQGRSFPTQVAVMRDIGTVRLNLN
jgi:hypothetical protein